jgi:hypothetical protein
MLAALVFLSSLAMAQAPNSAAVSKSASKDAKGMSILAQTMQATGWRRDASLHDAVLTGTITRHFPDASASTTPFVMKLRGDAQYDYVEGGSVHLVINGPAGAIKGSRRPSAQNSSPVRVVKDVPQ